jgi:uncharacterized membrane protein YdjX (TVP38/TMEM64 family)
MKPVDATRIALALAVGIGLVVAFVYREAFSEEALQGWLAQADIWAPLAFVAIYAAATVLFLPGSALTLAAGALFGAPLGAFYSLVGATLGATAAFLIARHLAGDWIARKAGGRMRQLIEGVEGEGWRFVAFVRLVPLFPFNLVNYALGLTRIPLVAYATTSFVCMAPGALAYAWLGHAGREALAGDAGAIRNGLLALALLAVVSFLPRLVRRFRSATMITPQTLQTLLSEGKVALVDVRSPQEFDGELEHVPGARNIPLAELSARVDELAPWRGQGVVLICRTDKRSATAARLLAQQGFAGVRVVRGGMEAWRRLERPLAPGFAVEGPGDAPRQA